MKAKPDEKEIASTILLALKDQKPETIDQLVTIVHQQVPNVSKEEILTQITKLKSEGKLTLTPPPLKAKKLSTYIRTGNALWYWLTTALATSTVISVFTITEDSPLILPRQVLGTIFILWLPGYTFIKALFPTQVPIKTSSESLDTIERVALSIGMSIALVPIIGLLLNYTPWGIRLAPITLSLLVLTMAFATTALIREYKIQTKEAEP